MEKAYEATAFCGTLFLCLCVVLAWSGACVWGCVWQCAALFPFQNSSCVVAWLSVGALTAEYKCNVCNRMSCSYKGGKLRLNIALFV